jgi:hypothetical protein
MCRERSEAAQRIAAEVSAARYSKWSEPERATFWISSYYQNYLSSNSNNLYVMQTYGIEILDLGLLFQKIIYVNGVFLELIDIIFQVGYNLFFVQFFIMRF